MQKKSELYAGKLIVEFRDDTSMVDGAKIEQFARKGMVNNKFTAFIMEKLEAAGIDTHHETLLSETEAVVKCLEMIPLECVVRNDEFSPDGCRLWDADTRRKLDKDHFRQGLGGVIEAYEEVAHRLGIKLDWLRIKHACVQTLPSLRGTK